jgi:hypothetical protein
LARKEIVTTPYRVSRRAPRIATPRPGPVDKPDTYAAAYFKKNPDVADTRPAVSKLTELDSRLYDYEFESDEKFTVLVRQSSLNFILYGEDSVESLRTHLALGVYYGENLRHESAVRHLQKAAYLMLNHRLEKDERISLAVELAEAHLHLCNHNRKQSKKHVTMAIEAMKLIQNDEIDDQMLRYRADLVTARILAARKKFSRALLQYEVALESLEAIRGEEWLVVKARIYLEMAEAAESSKDAAQAEEYYTLSYQTYVDLGMTESAAAIQDKVPFEATYDL